MDARGAAARILARVFEDGRSLAAALPPMLAELDDPRDRALAQDLCYGVLRGWPRLDAIAERLLRKPLAPRDRDIHCLVLAGLYQLIETRIPPHAAVAGSVDATAALGKPWARGLVNAVLRRFQREGQVIAAAVDTDDANACAHPRWLFERIRADWPDDWRAIMAANNARPPMWLRVNLARTTRDDYLAVLAQDGIEATPSPHAPAAVCLAQAIDVARLPGFAEGRVSVQDAAGQLAAGLLGLRPGQRVLDLCAAPGGKTCHMLETEPRLAGVVAVDHDDARLRRVGENLERLGLTAERVCADATADSSAWWHGEPFDRILLDAPCSASGVIRRHPDIKRLRRAADLPALARTQAQLLEMAWKMLADDGVLLYATCSIIHTENAEQIRGFLARHPEARADTLDAGWGRALASGRQILPGEDGMDGFYYARLRRAAGSGAVT